MTAEPKMEDLLASIRRAIHDDIGELPEAGAELQPGGAAHGSMRELRVRVGNEVSAAAAEIQELRNRISRSRELPPRRPAGREPVFDDHPAPEPATRDIERPEAGAIRPSFAEAELASYVSTLRDSSRRFAGEPEAANEPPRQVAARPGILSEEASTAAATAFNRLADTILNKAVGDRSIEDMARDMLKKLLKQWLDENLPSLVERLVREEIERVARRGR